MFQESLIETKRQRKVTLSCHPLHIHTHTLTQRTWVYRVSSNTEKGSLSSSNRERLTLVYSRLVKCRVRVFKRSAPAEGKTQEQRKIEKKEEKAHTSD